MSSNGNPVPSSENTVLASSEITKSARSSSHAIEASPLFAKLIPVNETARNAFHNAILYINEQSGHHLKQFISVDDSSATHDSSEECGDTTEYETDIDHGSLSKSQHFHGYFTLSFKILPLLPATIGWRIEKGSSKTPDGSRGTEFLLVRPSQKEAKKIAVVHAFIQLNVESGAFVLTAGSDKPIWYYSDNEEIKLQNFSQRVLSKPSNRFRIGDLEYKIVFEVANMTTFVQDRNEYLMNIHGRSPPHRKLDPIPQPNHRKLGHVIVHNSLSSDAFGWISIGVDSVTEHPRAVKELRIRNNYELKAAENEVALSRRFIKKHRGVLPFFQTWCEHGEAGPCRKFPEAVFISSALAYKDFSQYDWFDPFSVKLALFKDTLMGLDTFHKQGLMHRDITTKNLLILNCSPPEAALCDFGKTIEAKESADTTIGPKKTLAPEVWYSLCYNNKIDVWSLAYAWLDTFTFRGFRRRPDHVDDAEHRDMLEIIQYHCVNEMISEQFADLLCQMFSWNPENRLSTNEALKHPCWKDVANFEQNLNKIHTPKTSTESDTQEKRKSHHVFNSRSFQTRKTTMAMTAAVDCPPTQLAHWA